MKTSIVGMRLKPHFIPMSENTYRCVTKIRTPEEKFWGWVYFEERGKWTNSHNDGREYKTRTLAGRDLIERIAR